jgi:pyruvate,water dikinase
LKTRALLECGEASPPAASPRDVGGKAWNLLRLRDRGFLVPRFWIVPRGHFDRVVALCRSTIDGALSDGALGDARSAAARIGEAIRACPVPTDLTAELMDVLAAGQLFAVRSSAVGEDSRDHSFAGMLDSVLNVPRCDVASAIQRVWASAFSARALLYRQRKGLTLEQTATAVIVQEMVQAVSAGVLFTRDPEDGARSIVISAGLGLGQGVVEGAVETDTYRVGWEDGPWSAEVPVKRSRIVLADAGRGGTREERIPPRRGRRPALDRAQLRRLRRLGREVESALGGPQDIEWAHDAEGRLFVLQARPIVGGPERPGEHRVWDNANIVESYPGLTLPLTFSFASRAYRRAFSRVARSFRAPPARPDLYDGLIGLIDGRVYYNLLAWYEMFSFLPGSERYRESWDRLVGVAQRSAPPLVRVRFWTRARVLLASLAILLGAGSLPARFRARFDALRTRFAGVGGEGTVDEVLATFRALEDDAGSFWHLTLQNDFCALKLSQWAGALAGRWGGGELGGLLCGPEPVESVEPVRSLIALVEAVRTDPAARALFEREDDGAVWAALDAEPRWQELQAAFRRHLEEFGDRSVAELKLETVTFAEDPPRLVALVRRYLSLGVSAADLEGSRARRPAVAKPPGPRGLFRRVALRLVLDRARAAVCAREEMRLARTRLFGMVRRLFRRLGALLVEQGFLDSAGDVHYLAVEELLDFARGTGVTREIRDLVALRRAEYRCFGESAAPSRLETVGIPRLRVPPAPDPVDATHRFLTGSGCSAGIASGRATVVLEPERAEPGRDRILVARSTDPGWVFLMMSSAGIVVERGSPLSHTAIIGRELGIPTVVGAAGATRLIPEGARLQIDGGTGDVRWA